MVDMRPHKDRTPPAFLEGGGEMGERIRAYDWSKTPVGPPEGWPQSLRVTVRLMLNSQHPMFIWWGPELVQLYNDGYRQTMGPEMHPGTLGAKGKDSWAEIWPIIGPQIEFVMSGRGSTWNVEQMVPIHRHGRFDEVWWTYGYSPIDLEDGVGGVLVVCTDVTEQHRERERFKAQTARLAHMFEEAPGFIAVMTGPQHQFELANAAYRRLIGNRDIVGKPVREALPDIAGQGFYELLDQVYQTGKSFVGRRVPVALQATVSSLAEKTYLDFVYQPILEEGGAVSGIFVEGQDVTEHVAVEDHLRLINGELRHRVKNTLAMASAVGAQTFRGVAPDSALRAFAARLSAFAKAHDALTEGANTFGQLGEVISSAVTPHLADRDMLSISGPAVEVGAKPAVALALAMHEMATNAVKYGALSVPTGRVQVTWSVDAKSAQLHLTWREVGGPVVSTPTRTGFGSRVVRSVLSSQVGGTVDLMFEQAGVVMTLSAPVANLRGTEDPAFAIESGTL
jgi:two-component sensor histidine kinase